MHSPASVVENKAHKLLRDFDIHTDHLISERRPDLIITPSRTCKTVDFAVPADQYLFKIEFLFHFLGIYEYMCVFVSIHFLII